MGRAPDGTLAYHRGVPASQQRVEVVAGAEVGQVGFLPSLWSPDSRRILTTVPRVEQVTNEFGIRETVERDYVVVRARDGVDQARSFPVSFANPVGWSAVPLTPGTACGRLQ